MQRSIACLVLACLLGAACTASAARPGCVCTAVYDPVCGENGKEYSNSCQADCAGVAVAYSGSCRATATSTGLTLPGLIGSILGTGSSSATPSPDDCMCTKQYNPVCGDDGVTYPNQCQATCAGAAVVEDGECGAAATSKTKTPAAVTQEDGPAVKASSTDAPAPAAAAAAAPAATSGRKPGCVCAALYMPVCGADGKTYSNACDADCAGVAVAAQGMCEDAVSTADTGAPAAAPAPAPAPDAPTELQPAPAADGGAKPGCVCAAVYEPVCGDDGQDYSNACEADCAGAAVLRKGPCSSSSSSLPAGSSSSSSDSCVCPIIYAPVCTKKGATRSNKCIAECKGEKVAYDGPCKPKVPGVVDEASTKDNSTTVEATAADANASFTATANDGAAATAAALSAPEDCSKPCNDFYAPVCGADGSTYANSCVAQCSGKTTVAKAGACPGSSTVKTSGAASRSSSAGMTLLAAAFSAVWLVGILL